jgi:hypothetical protein
MSIMKSTDRRINPEARLYGAMFGAVWLPIGLFIYSFTQYGYIPWVYLSFTHSFTQHMRHLILYSCCLSKQIISARVIAIKIKRNMHPVPFTASSN